MYNLHEQRSSQICELLYFFAQKYDRIFGICSKGDKSLSKVDSTIKAETKNIAIAVLILSALLEAVYLILGLWNYTVLLGNLLGGAAGILNFFLMGLGLQSALKKDAKDAKTTAKFSYTYRYIILGVVIVIGIFVPIFDMVATIASLFFSSLGVYVRFFVTKRNNNVAPSITSDSSDETTEGTDNMTKEVSEE